MQRSFLFNVQSVVQADLGGLTHHALLRSLGGVGREQHQVDLVCNLLIAHRLGGRDLQIEHIWVGHIAVVQLIVLADEGLAFISQFWSKCHRESLPINSSSVQYNTSMVQDASF